jgi:hypothetical protein
MRDEDKAERREECEREGVPYEPGETLGEPKLPEYIGRMPRGKLPEVRKLARGEQPAGLMEAAHRLNHVSRRARCPRFDSQD